MSHELNVLARHLVEGLAPIAMKTLREVWDDQAFGSGFIELGRATPELRLVWDGKDGWAYLQTANACGGWSDIFGPIAESDFRLGAPDERKITSMLDAAKTATGG